MLWLVDRLVRVNFIMVAEITGPLTEAGLRAGLDAAQARHPLLQVRISEEGRNRGVFRSTPGAPIPLRVLDAPAEAWVAEAENELRTLFPTGTAPLARALWLRHDNNHSTLLLTFHHSIGDATAGTYLIRDVLRSVSQASRGEATALVPLVPRASIEAHSPAWSRSPKAVWQYLRFTARLLIDMLFHGKPRAVVDRPEIPLAERRVHILPRRIEGDLLQRLVARCRAEGTTVHGALNAAMGLALAQDLRAEQAVPLCLSSPVNLRKQMEPPVGEDVGLFVSMAPTFHRIGPRTSFWDLAREVRSELTGVLTRGEPFSVLPTLARLGLVLERFFSGPRATERWLHRLAPLIIDASGITNLGIVDIETRMGELSIASVHFSASLGNLGYIMSTATTLNQVLRWNFCYMQPCLEPARAERIADESMRRIEQALDETPAVRATGT
jgi:hypothetical protein